MSARLQTLAEVEAAVWRELGQAARDREHPWRTPVLASTDGEFADARTVVLREVRAEGRELVVYSDSRAMKVPQLQAQPMCTLVMWSPALRWQLRLRARVQVHTDGLAVTSRWARLLHTAAARDYLAHQAPGAPLVTAATPSAEPASERAHFAVLVANVETLDWLELDTDGHRRARFGLQFARWLSP